MKDFTKFIRSLRLEGLALAILMVTLIHFSSAPLWILPATFLLFDIGMIGYLINNKVGAHTYNAVHNATFPTLLIALGLIIEVEWVSVLGICWTFHIAVDRTLGYGLKHEESFMHTHLGKIGKKK
jgi:uncharacterized membrane protein AbrB (regulator of aidB expression)